MRCTKKRFVKVCLVIRDSKISTLNRIINSDSKGRYVLDSKFEIAETYRIIDNDSKALGNLLGYN